MPHCILIKSNTTIALVLAFTVLTVSLPMLSITSALERGSVEKEPADVLPPSVESSPNEATNETQQIPPIGQDPQNPQSSPQDVPPNAIACSSVSNPCNGTDDNDKMTGDNGMNSMYGHKNDDSMLGGGSPDSMSGDEGNDEISGDDGDDFLYGDGITYAEGNDTLNGNAGNDQIYGASGHDVINGGDSDDLIDGGNGDDILEGGNGNDVIRGGMGFDSITGGPDNDKIYHSDLNLLIKPDGSKDKIDCGPGQDEAWVNTMDDGDETLNCEIVHGAGPRGLSGNSLFIVPVKLNNDGISDMFIYDRESHTAESYTVSPNGDISLMQTHLNLPPATQIMPIYIFFDNPPTMTYQMLFFYDQTSQTGEFWQLDADGYGQIRTIKSNINLPGNWPNIVTMNLGQGTKAPPGYLNPIIIPGLLFYSTDGKGEFNTVSQVGDLKLVKSDSTWRSTWTQIIPVNLNNDAVTDLLFYSPSEGTGQFYTVTPNGNIKLIKTYTDWRSTWSQIIPVNINNDRVTDLLFYSPSEGTGEFDTVSSNGNLKHIKTYTDWRSTWSQIIPIQLDNILNTDLFFYSPSEHYGEFYTVANNGDINLLKSHTN